MLQTISTISLATWKEILWLSPCGYMSWSRSLWSAFEQIFRFSFQFQAVICATVAQSGNKNGLPHRRLIVASAFGECIYRSCCLYHKTSLWDLFEVVAPDDSYSSALPFCWHFVSGCLPEEKCSNGSICCLKVSFLTSQESSGLQSALVLISNTEWQIFPWSFIWEKQS